MKDLTKIQRKLIALLDDIDCDDDDLYRFTGYNFDDVKTVADYNEIVRLFSNWYFVDNWYIEEA